MKRSILSAVALAITAIAPISPVEAESPQNRKSATPEFLRVTTHLGQPKALETAITRYRSKGGGDITVDLIAAVHIGEAAYYEQLNQLFDQYDVLLYELVAPADAPAPSSRNRDAAANPISILQGTTQSMLGLESQLERVNYQKPHFVRADMTPDQIGSKMKERGDTPITVALSTIVDFMRQQNLAAQRGDRGPAEAPESLLEIVDSFGDPLKMKRLMAEQFTESGSLDMVGRSLNQMLVIDRNAEALKGLQKQLAAGKRKIGIFYGAAHMPDFDKRLRADFDMRRKNQQWLVAWDLTQTQSPDMSDPAQLFLQLLNTLE